MNESAVRFVLGAQIVAVQDFDPQLTVLDWLRARASRTGTKEGCAEGDCGACTVVLGELDDSNGGIRYRAVNACIQLLATLDGCQLITVEDLAGDDGSLHPVQQALVDRHASQCGFCTPGFVMSLFALYHQPGEADRRQIEESIAGNLCRCTGYRPILDAAADALAGPRSDRFSAAERETAALLRGIRPDRCLHLEHQDRHFYAPVSVTELSEVLAEHPGAVMVAGATDVGLWINKQLASFDTLVYLGRVAGLRDFGTSDRFLEIGAAVTYSEAMGALTGHYPELRPYLARFGAVQVRNAGTMAPSAATSPTVRPSATWRRRCSPWAPGWCCAVPWAAAPWPSRTSTSSTAGRTCSRVSSWRKSCFRCRFPARCSAPTSCPSASNRTFPPSARRFCSNGRATTSEWGRAGRRGAAGRLRTDQRLARERRLPDARRATPVAALFPRNIGRGAVPAR
jgi:aerobic-type carbon monoxide dehydrogenase small subunit (CoxS/CutS family)